MKLAHRPMIQWMFVLLVIGLFRQASAAEKSPQSQPARELSAAGSAEMLWIALGEWDPERDEFVTRFWCRQSHSEQIVSPRSLMPQLNRVRQCAVAGQVFDVFFSNGAHYRYNATRQRRAHQLAGKTLPLAMAGDVQDGGAKIWAVVSPELGAEVESNWRRHQQNQNAEAEDRASDDDKSSHSIGQLPLPVSSDRTPRIVMYDGRVWQPMVAAASESTGAHAFWLAAADGRLHLFWKKEEAGREIFHARYENGKWTPGTTIVASSSVRKAAAAVINKQVVFAALVQGPDERELGCERWSRGMASPPTGAWNRPPAILDVKGAPLKLPIGSVVALFSDRLVLLKSDKDKIEAGFWLCEAGGKPDQAFAPLPTAISHDGHGSPGGLRDFLTMVVIAGMFMLVFWRRQETLTSSIALPEGFQVAGVGRRTLAFAIDAIPAAVIVFAIWHGPIEAFYQAVNVAAASGERAVEPPREIMWAWFWFRVMYTAYCTAFEAMWTTTPGKRLLGCVVISETLERPGLLQIGIRNVARMVELEPYLKIWPFLFVVFFTRNRQRMGDLLARTMVVERQTKVLPDEKPGEDNSSGA